MVAQTPLPQLSTRLRRGENLLMAWCGMNEAAIAETLAREGFDAVLVDMQHGAVDVTTTIAAIAQVGLAGKPTLARIPVGDFATASRLLDAGAAAIVAPMINSAADAANFASFVKYPPLGMRSWGPGRALGLSGLDPDPYFRGANAMHLAIAMIETREALTALDAILDTPGIDGVLVGPSDLSIALTRGGGVNHEHPEVEQALDHILRQCKARQKFASLFCVSGKKAKAMTERGFQLCSVATDGMLLRNAARAELANAR